MAAVPQAAAPAATIARSLARFAAALSCDAIPGAVRERAI